MPKDESLQKILLIGSGPIVIGQGCEFDYSGTQACKALKEEGFEVVLVNSNPATIMTDPEFADRTYIEPITPDVIRKIIEKEKPDALLPTLGGQTALNAAMDLWHSGTLKELGVKMIGAKADAIAKGEDRQLFKEAMLKIGLDLPRAREWRTAWRTPGRSRRRSGPFPFIIRPAYTLGGSGGGIAYNKEEFETIVTRGLDLSPVTEVLIEESLLGWKEYEMEVMRDCADNCVVICAIENLDPMGVHTGDSITVAPAQTLTDREYQIMRDQSFAMHPRDRGGDRRVEHPVRGESAGRAPHRDRDESRASRAVRRWPRRRPASRSPRSRRSSRWATPSTSSRTTSRARHRRASSRPSTTW